MTTPKRNFRLVLDSSRVLAGPSRYDLAPDEWCSDYHCAGDCGLLGHGYQHAQPHEITPQRKRDTLAAFDALEHADKRDKLDAAAEVRRKARNAL